MSTVELLESAETPISFLEDNIEANIDRFIARYNRVLSQEESAIAHQLLDLCQEIIYRLDHD